MSRLLSAVLHSAAAATERERDRELLSRVAGGDVAALRALYDQHAGRAMSVAFRILRDVPEAEDVVQETFVELWRRSEQFNHERGGAVSWIVTIARSRAIDRKRALGSAARAVGASADEAPQLPCEAEPLECAHRSRTRAEVLAALEGLPPEQRQTIELAYYEGLSQSEIAARTGNPLGTVKMRVKLAMSKLRAVLGHHDERDQGCSRRQTK